MSDFSSEQPIKAECAEVLAEVWTLLDGECDAETKGKLQQHLDDCPPCFQFYGLEQRMKLLISNKCRGDKAPVEFRQRLMLTIQKTTMLINPDADDTERP